MGVKLPREQVVWLCGCVVAVSLVGRWPVTGLVAGLVGGVASGVLAGVGRPRPKGRAPSPPVALATVCLAVVSAAGLVAPLRVEAVMGPQILVLLACIGAYRARLVRTSVPGDLPIAVLLLSAGTVGLLISPDSQRSLLGLLRLAAGVGTYYLTIGTVRSEAQLRVAWTALVWVSGLAGFAALGLLLPSMAGSFLPWDAVHRLERLQALLPAVNPNYLAGTLVMLLCAPYWAAVSGGRRDLLSWLSLLAVALGLLVCRSRGAYLGAVVAILATTALYRPRWGGRLALVGGAALAIWAIGLDSGAMGRLVEMSKGRVEIWRRAIMVIQDFPLTGVGLRGFPHFVESLYPILSDSPGLVPHAHNELLQVAVDVGIPGYVSFCMLMGVWAATSVATLGMRSSTEARGLRQAVAQPLTGAIVGGLVFGVTDAIALGEPAGIVRWVLMGLAVAVHREPVDGPVR